MKQISSMDLYYLVEEFKILENQRIDTFYLSGDIFYIKVYVTGKGNVYLVNRISKYVFLDESKVEVGEPTGFITYLRKYLKSGFIRTVEQIEEERIIRITIDKKDGEEIKKYQLYLELFANGNIILCSEENIILNSLIKRSFKDRKVRVREEYVLPPKKNNKIKIGKLDTTLVKYIASNLGFGGKFSEEVCSLAGLDKNKDKITKEDLKVLKRVITELKKKKLEAYNIISENNINDFIPFEFKSINLEKKKVDSFNLAVKDYYSQFLEENDKNEDEFQKEIKKLKNRLAKQEELKKHIESEYEVQNSYGNKIYENYALIEDLLKSINKSAKDKGWDYVLDKIKSDEKLSSVIKKLDYKNNKIELEL